MKFGNSLLVATGILVLSVGAAHARSCSEFRARCLQDFPGDARCTQLVEICKKACDKKTNTSTFTGNIRGLTLHATSCS